ncbi:hypothetical protein [Paracoccus sediminicola]|uniref:hypothetical protein n=1 Tax=Paracoccus sediminicola TaxID=3017783 RepID=UPI0022F13EC9|nr:hypothetical protein [Paracoccus sediminicola]WBU57178.1 hypothetical protein PAF18_01655 [Paracoccus sediminicola]
MGLFSGISNALGGIGKALGLGQIMKSISGLLNSPFGALMKLAFPQLALASSFLNFSGMMGNLAGGIGGGAEY